MDGQHLEWKSLIVFTVKNQVARLFGPKCAAQFFQVDKIRKRNWSRKRRGMVQESRDVDVFELGDWVPWGRRTADSGASYSALISGADVEFAKQRVLEIEAGEATRLLERASGWDQPEAADNIGWIAADRKIDLRMRRFRARQKRNNDHSKEQ